MATEHTLRRLARVKTLPMFKNKGDEALIIYLEDALSVFLDYTHRSVDPGEGVDGLICDIAKLNIGKEGAEGVKKAKDGEFEREWAVETGLPTELTARMKMYRQVVGVNATPKL